MSDRRNLTKGPVGGHLFRLGWPMTIGVAAILSVSLADSFYLGQLGTEELAAISFTFPVILVVTSIGIGMSAGTASVASRAIGRGDRQDARRLASDSLILSLLIISVVSALGALFARPLFGLIGAEGQVLDMVVAYMRVWFLSVPLFVLPMVAMGLMRANGDSVAPSAIMVIGSLINVASAPAFIFGLGPIDAMGVEGAAWATLWARVISFVAALALVVFRERLVTFVLPTPAEFARSASQILRVGVPAAGSNMINPLSIAIVTSFLASYGDEAVAAFGVATRVETLTTIPMLALSSAIGPVAGQNWGSGQPVRTARAMKLAFAFVLLCGLVLGGSFFVFADVLIAPFSDDTVVLNIARSYLVLVGITLGGYGIVINASAALNAIDRAVLGLFFTIFRSFVLYVPLAAVAMAYGPTWLVFLSIAGTNVLSGLIVGFAALRVVARDGQNSVQAPSLA